MMKTLNKIIAGTAAAIAIGGGALMVSNLNSTPDTDTDFALLDVPVLQVPVLEIPTLQVDTLQIVTPEISGVEIAPLAIAELGTQNLDAETIQISAVDAEILKVTSIDGRIAAFQKFMRELRGFADQRGIDHDLTLDPESAAWQKWLVIYRENKPYMLDYKPLPENLRVICEVKCPADSVATQTLADNLAFYKNQGYNAVLMTFDTTESLARLMQTAELIRAHGMKIIGAYAGPERLEWSVFQDPDKIADYVQRLAAHCDAWMIGWRRTSVHLFIQDAPFTNHILRAARSGNREIAVIGEAYLGQTAHSNESTKAVTYNVPANASAVLLFGIGYKGLAIERAMDGVFPRVKNLPRLGLAIGERAYYDSRFNTHKTFAENLAIKQRIERRFKRGGCVGTFTIRADGSDGIYDKNVTEDLSQKYKEAL